MGFPTRAARGQQERHLRQKREEFESQHLLRGRPETFDGTKVAIWWAVTPMYTFCMLKRCESVSRTVPHCVCVCVCVCQGEPLKPSDYRRQENNLLKTIPNGLVLSRDDSVDTEITALFMENAVTGWHVDDYGWPGVSFLLPEASTGCVKHWEFFVGDLGFVPEEAGGVFRKRTKGNLIITQQPGQCIYIPSCIYHRVTTVGAGLSCGSFTSRQINLEAFGRRLGVLRYTEERSNVNANMLQVLALYSHLFPPFPPHTTDSTKIAAVIQVLREPYTRKRKNADVSS